MIPHSLYDYVSGTMIACSILHMLLPPWEFLGDFPTAQKYYKAFLYLVGYVGANARSAVWKQISIKNPNGFNGNGKTNGGNNVKEPQ